MDNGQWEPRFSSISNKVEHEIEIPRTRIILVTPTNRICRVQNWGEITVLNSNVAWRDFDRSEYGIYLSRIQFQSRNGTGKEANEVTNFITKNTVPPTAALSYLSSRGSNDASTFHLSLLAKGGDYIWGALMTEAYKDEQGFNHLRQAGFQRTSEEEYGKSSFKAWIHQHNLTNTKSWRSSREDTFLNKIIVVSTTQL